jgi:hypothetical protein
MKRYAFPIDVLGRLCAGALCVFACAPLLAQDELKRLLDRQLAPPLIKAEAGFTARVLVPPGNTYDPLWMLPRGGGVVWLNDDGGAEQSKGGRLLAVDRKGAVTVMAGIGKFIPMTAWDVAPATFGKYGGQIFTLAQVRTGFDAVYINHVIQRIEPARDYAASIFCTLPTAGQANKGIPGIGADGRFGPEGSPFAGKFFSVTTNNDTIYQTTADGECRPFITFDGVRFASPLAITFTTDGKTMLVTGRVGARQRTGAGAVARVTPDGKLEDTLIAHGLNNPGGLDIAPQGFGKYAGELFVADGCIVAALPCRWNEASNGGVFRVARDGTVHLVVTGFRAPIGVRFVDDRSLWVSDIGGDYITGGSTLPDGFIAEIQAK